MTNGLIYSSELLLVDPSELLCRTVFLPGQGFDHSRARLLALEHALKGRENEVIELMDLVSAERVTRRRALLEQERQQRELSRTARRALRRLNGHATDSSTESDEPLEFVDDTPETDERPRNRMLCLIKCCIRIQHPANSRTRPAPFTCIFSSHIQGVPSLACCFGYGATPL